MRDSPLVLKVKRLFDKVPLRKEKREELKDRSYTTFLQLNLHGAQQQEEIKMSHSVDVTLFATVDS